MIYLASPYTHKDPFVREQRYLATMQAFIELLKKKEYAISSILHCHELAKIGDLPFNQQYWWAYNQELLLACSKLVILKLPGWEESEGVKMEKTLAESAGIPVTYL